MASPYHASWPDPEQWLNIDLSEIHRDQDKKNPSDHGSRFNTKISSHPHANFHHNDKMVLWLSHLNTGYPQTGSSILYIETGALVQLARIKKSDAFISRHSHISNIEISSDYNNDFKLISDFLKNRVLNKRRSLIRAVSLQSFVLPACNSHQNENACTSYFCNENLCTLVFISNGP